MKVLSRFLPKTIEGQLVATLGISIILLLGVLTTFDVMDRRSPIEWAESGATLNRLARMQTILENVSIDRRGSLLRSLSVCHDGYTLAAHRFEVVDVTEQTAQLEDRIAQRLSVGTQRVSVGYATLTSDDFSYGDCTEAEIDLPMTAIVISVQLESGGWFNAEVHPHEWHLQDFVARIFRYSLAVILVGIFALFLIRRLSKPLNDLTDAAKQFAAGLNVSPVGESGPPDLRRAIQSFNAMQQQVASDVKKRTDTLAAISHDLRTPLTALRIRGELVDDEETRGDLVASIDKMEKIIASALEYLRGESRSEPHREVDLSALLASECNGFKEAGRQAEFVGETGVQYSCRPDALARAVRNLVENANKYGGGARVDLRVGAESLDISVSDTGPGIPAHEIDAALEPFRRLSKARESQQGGFGLGLAIVEAIVKGHDGELILTENSPSGLVATIRLPTVPSLSDSVSG
jgi:signal transduction histidine kinase